MEMHLQDEEHSKFQPSEIDLEDVWKALVRQKQIVIFSVAALAIFAFAYLNFAARTYTIELQVTPTESQGSKFGGGLSGLASIAGVSLSTGKESPSFDLYFEGLHSLEAADTLSKDKALMREIFPDEWDKKKQQWREPQGIIRWLISAIKLPLGMSYGWEAPNTQRMQEFLVDEIKISKDSNRPVVTVTFQNESPEVGVKLLTALHDAVDEDLRERALKRSTSYIDYLYAQLQEVSVAEYREALVELIAEQEKRRMVASSNLSYAAEPFSGPSSSFRPTKPQPIFVLIISVFLGLILGIILAVVRDSVARDDKLSDT